MSTSLRDAALIKELLARVEVLEKAVAALKVVPAKQTLGLPRREGVKS